MLMLMNCSASTHSFFRSDCFVKLLGIISEIEDWMGDVHSQNEFYEITSTVSAKFAIHSRVRVMCSINR